MLNDSESTDARDARALWLEDGQLRFDGHPEEAVSAYEAHA